MNMAEFRLRGFLVLLVVAVLLSGCGGTQGGAALNGTGLQVAESGIKWAPSPSPTPVPTFSLVLSKGWNAFTFPLATSKKVSEITMTYGGQTKILKNAVTAGWTKNGILYLRGRSWAQLLVSRDNNLLQPGGRYNIWCAGNRTVLNLDSPVVKGVAPGSGAPGSAITISGVKFGAAQGDSIVTVGGVSVGTVDPPENWSDTQITCTVPENAPGGSQPVLVTVGGRAGNGDCTFTVIIPPFINKYEIGTGLNADADVDGAGNVYVVYERSGSVYLVKNRGAEELISVGTGPAIAVDSANNVHVLYINGSLVYRKKTGEAWGAERAVAGGVLFYSIDTDSLGSAHVAYGDGGTSGRGHIVYIKDDGGAWSAPIFDIWGWYDSGSGTYYFNPVIRIDSADKYHFAFYQKNWGGQASWSDVGITVLSNSVYGDKGFGGWNWNTGISFNRKAMSLNGAVAHFVFNAGATLYLARVDVGWNILPGFAGSVGTIGFNGGITGASYYSTGVKYKEDTGSGYGDAVDIDPAGTNPTVVVSPANTFIFYEKDSKIWLAPKYPI